jgi:hypothetical protein
MKLTPKRQRQLLRSALVTALGLEGRYCEVGGFEMTTIRLALKLTLPPVQSGRKKSK